MTERNYNKYDILLDVNLDLADQQTREEVEKLLAADPLARTIHSNLDFLHKNLQSWTDQNPPSSLHERTMELVEQYEQARSMARSSEVIARSKKEQTPGETRERISWIVGNLRDLITVAACLLLVFTFLQPFNRSLKQSYHKAQCANNLRQIQSGLAAYAQDNLGWLPLVQRQEDKPWWTVGKQTPDNNSNTRNVFLLVKGNYVPAKAFVCPGSDHQPRIRIKVDPETLKTLQDFAGRDKVHYSFRLIDKKERLNEGHKIIASDQNPLFAEFDADRQTELDLTQKPRLLQVNSPNHHQAGQNILSNDGSVRFSDTRLIGSQLDDIFTIQSTTRYTGTETPADHDTFTAP